MCWPAASSANNWGAGCRICLPLLATPHAAMAIGLVLWLSPSGWALRLVSPGLTGFDAPPPWFTTQDPWGLGLILALWLKEVPVLLWVAATQMQREDLRRRWQAEYALAQTLGRTPAQAFAQIIWPQLAPRLRWPLLGGAGLWPHGGRHGAHHRPRHTAHLGGAGLAMVERRRPDHAIARRSGSGVVDGHGVGGGCVARWWLLRVVAALRKFASRGLRLQTADGAQPHVGGCPCSRMLAMAHRPFASRDYAPAENPDMGSVFL